MNKPNTDFRNQPMIGVIGQGWVGRHYADHFKGHGYCVVRYSLEPEYVQNRAAILTCDLVFIAVPTPTIPGVGVDHAAVRAVLPLVGKGKVAVIKSTVAVGFTAALQKEFSHCTILHCPEFLSEKTAAHDVALPSRTIIGLSVSDETHKAAAHRLWWEILPQAPFHLICTSNESELIKYAHNASGFLQVIFTNLLFDLGSNTGASWDVLKKAIAADPDVSHTYLNPVHNGGRGAGGHCFIKDFEAFLTMVDSLGELSYSLFLRGARKRNVELLMKTGKDSRILEQTYGREFLDDMAKL